MEGFREEIDGVRGIMSNLRKATPRGPQARWTQAAQVSPKQVLLNGRTVTAINITLTPTGCAWAHAGGCTVCGEYAGSNLGSRIPGEVHVSQFVSSLATAVPQYGPQWLRIYQEGSFLNPSEVDPRAASTILSTAALLGGVERITIESRPEFLTEDAIAVALEAAQGRTGLLEIGIGLEVCDDTIREVCVNKDLNLKVLESTVTSLRQAGIRTLAYVLVKPPFRTEGEALRESVETARYAFELGFDAVSLEPVSVCSWSLVDMLRTYSMYSPPWLWTVLAAAQEAYSLGEIRIGGSEYFPTPNARARNHCNSSCSTRAWNAIKQYNASREIHWLEIQGCSCEAQWQEALRESAPPLRERIRRFLDIASVDDYARSLQPRPTRPTALARELIASVSTAGGES